ncbi:RNA polymerase sigma-70 factor (ECF subfamily) [Phyllobacterium sp. 1468]|uniref:sigma factor-like helix-turn-helix DNA-binding protein n=1 Tax=Phyllobacterium sp. 1468 TaxID=2817759 RepID=UPI001AE930F3|nr:sigma factor-like helix-turn-helix DNA-binding protein [Phyllobacterium sp. 1468]MDR6636155.1 RNA polymerase sigma-70 factor (ECF subfamily) [Phyllobacterium sp. 1468]
MTDEREIREDLSQCLGRLWRFGMILSFRSDVTLALVEATCVRALERAPLLIRSSRLDCWLFSTLHSIWQTKVTIRDENSEMRFIDNAVLQRVSALPDEYRAAVFLAYVEHMSYAEVAKVLVIPISTVVSRLAAARIMLAESADVAKASGLAEAAILVDRPA